MRAVALILLALFAFSPIAPAVAQERAESAAARHGVPAERVVSPGGIEAWLVADATVPMLVLQAYWHGGAAIEPETHIGVSSALADMLTEGAGDLDAQAFKQRLEDLNMSLGFSSSWDGMGMSLVTLTENRDAAFEMARMALMQPRFDAASLERLRRQWQVGILQRDTNPSYLAGAALDDALYPDHPYARRTTNETVAAIDLDALEERKGLLFARDRMQITVVGDIDAQALGLLLDQTFGALPATTSIAVPPDASLQAPTPLIVRPLPQPQSLIVFAAPGMREDHPDWMAFAVANYILGGGGFSSRLMSEVREARGLVYGVGTGNSVRDHVALLRGSAQTENGNVAEAIEVIRAEMARLAQEGATRAEVDDAITYLTGSFALDLDSNRGISDILHSYQIIGRDIDYINERNDMLRAVRREDVNRVAREYFDPARFTFVVVGQPEGLDVAAAP